MVKLLGLGWVLALLFWVAPAHAYSWMIRHEYTGCATCHVDPSGGYLLTPYGRAQTQTLLSSFGRAGKGEDVDKRSEFAWGVGHHLPPWLNLGVSVREAFMASKEVSPAQGPTLSRFMLMQADLRAAVTVDRFVATGSIGYLQDGHHAAQINKGARDVLVSREFWAGYYLGDDRDTFVRVGRLYLPFGLRVIEHPFYVRSSTATNIDSQQQYGASLFLEREGYRAELMAIAGNYQLYPDAYRQRGYSGYVEFAVRPRLQFGMSSMLTYAKLDPDLLESVVRGAHGAMARWSPEPPLALLAEVDIVHTVLDGTISHAGYVSLAQLDYELVRGLHGIFSTEFYRPARERALWNNREWLSVAWFAYPHVDLRLDGYWASESFVPTARTNSLAALGQIHVSL